jgi:CDP-paratose synthetase
MNGSKTILVTGATGYLGSHLVSGLLRESYHVIIIKRSTSSVHRIQHMLAGTMVYNIDEISFSEIFNKHKVDTVLHCATNYGKKSRAWMEVISSNFLFPLQLLESAVEAGVRCFINTDTVLGENVNAYALSKHQFKDWLKMPKQMAAVNVILDQFYGPADNDTNLITHLIKQMLSNVDKIDMTAGEQRKGFVYIEDVVSAFLRIIYTGPSLKNGYHEFEVGSSYSYSIKEVAGQIKMLSGNQQTKLNFGALPYRENEQMDYHMNLDAIYRLGWKEQYDLKSGLLKSIDYEKHAHNNIGNQ